MENWGEIEHTFRQGACPQSEYKSFHTATATATADPTRPDPSQTTNKQKQQPMYSPPQS
jgi:hypothetical protein